MTIATADNPTPQQQIERNFRWNFAVNAADGASFWFGMSFISSVTILPLYVSHFTQDPFYFGLISFLASAGYLLPQLFMANAVTRSPRKKFYPVVLGFFSERIPIFLLAPTAYFLATARPTAALITFLLLYGWHTFGAGVIIVGWQDMIAKIIPVEKRGRFFGITNFVGNGAGVLGALAVPVVLAQYPFPLGYVIAFGLAAALILLSWVFISLTREPAVPSRKPRVSQQDYLRSLPEVLRQDSNFRAFLLTQIAFAVSGMATGFLTVYAAQRWQMADAQAGGFTVALQIGLALANLFFGFLSDRKGHKLSLEICQGLNVLLLVLAITAPSAWWFYAVFFLRGAVNAGMFVSGISIVYELTDAENRPTYIGLANTVPGVAGTVAPLIGAWLATLAGYQTVFGVAVGFGILSWLLLHFVVVEPRKKAMPQPQPAQ